MHRCIYKKKRISLGKVNPFLPITFINNKKMYDSVFKKVAAVFSSS